MIDPRRENRSRSQGEPAATRFAHPTRRQNPRTRNKCRKTRRTLDHPMVGQSMRAAIGGGKAVIGSNVKVAAAGAILDVPLGHKDDSWSFPHFDTITVSVADAPRPDEILVVMEIVEGGGAGGGGGTAPIR